MKGVLKFFTINIPSITRVNCEWRPFRITFFFFLSSPICSNCWHMKSSRQCMGHDDKCLVDHVWRTNIQPTPLLQWSICMQTGCVLVEKKVTKIAFTITHRLNTSVHFSHALTGHRCHLDMNLCHHLDSQHTAFPDKWQHWYHSNDAISRIFCVIWQEERNIILSAILSRGLTSNSLIFDNWNIDCLQCLRS